MSFSHLILSYYPLIRYATYPSNVFFFVVFNDDLRLLFYRYFGIVIIQLHVSILLETWTF